MNYSLAAFQEPRGVMRILQFVSHITVCKNLLLRTLTFHFRTQIFAIVAFSTTANFSVDVEFKCATTPNDTKTIDYPFRFSHHVCTQVNTKNEFYMAADVSSDAQVKNQLQNIIIIDLC